MAKYTFLKSSKIEDYVKMLVYPITALKFDTGGLNLPPAVARVRLRKDNSYRD